MPELINTPDEVIDRLGGNSVVARMFEPPLTPNAVGNWRERGLPPETFWTLTAALNANGLYAPPSLWRMREPAVAVQAQWPA
jgi:hypothetical protein